ncbi:MAG: hypothetical protein HY691_19295 [Chloroflexi bacterium]|nr:hypothetical protein [Chloroflexota bacterium]
MRCPHLADEMRSLTEGLAHAHRSRQQGLAALRAGVGSALLDTRRQMATLGGARAGAASALHHGLARGAAFRRAAVAGDLAGLAHTRRESAATQRRALATGAARRRADVQQAMRQVQRSRAAAGATARAARRRSHADLAHRIARLLAVLCRDRTGMAATQRVTLHADRVALHDEMARFLGAQAAARAVFARTQRGALRTSRTLLRAEVGGALRGFRAARRALAEDLRQLHYAWRRPATAGRQPPAATVLRPPPVVPPEPPPLPAFAEVETALAAPSIAEAVAEALAGSPRERLEGAIFAHLADHPDGLRTVDLETHFGLARIQLVQVLNRLIEQNRVRRDQERRLYFAI